MCRNFIYLSKIVPLICQGTYDDLLQVISKENREKCRRFKFREDALRTLYGELILRYVLCRKLSFENEDIEILRSNEGKPYLKGFPIHFNISHSGDFVVCAFSEEEVGVDIEKIKEVDFKIAKRFFSKQECEDLFAKEENERLDYFFSLWTLKESYLKWMGKGMKVPLDSFHFTITDAGISLTDTNRKTKPTFKQYQIDGHKIAVCKTAFGFPDEITEITVEEVRLGIKI
jgi:4'-phosphopantetheinyl transferase